MIFFKLNRDLAELDRLFETGINEKKYIKKVVGGALYTDNPHKGIAFRTT